MSGSVIYGRGGKSQGLWSTTSSDQPKFQLQLSNPLYTQKIINSLCNHSADCQILFSSEVKQSHPDNGYPSAKDKVSIYAIIAKHVFKDNSDYMDHYANAPDKFWESTNNHIQA